MRSKRRSRRPLARSTARSWTCACPINRKTGAYDTFRRWKVFADESNELEVPERELRMDDAREIDKDVEVGGYVEEPMESVPFGRILAQTAKQVIVQKVREAERAQVVDAYKDRAGTLVSGIVKRVDRNGIYVDLGSNAEGYIAREEMIRASPYALRTASRPFSRKCAPSRAARSSSCRAPRLNS